MKAMILAVGLLTLTTPAWGQSQRFLNDNIRYNFPDNIVRVPREYDAPVFCQLCASKREEAIRVYELRRRAEVEMTLRELRAIRRELRRQRDEDDD